MIRQLNALDILDIETDEKAEFVVTFNLYRGIADYVTLKRSSNNGSFRGIEKNIEKIVKRCLESIKMEELEDL